MSDSRGRGIGLSRSDVFWELTRAAKLGRIASAAALISLTIFPRSSPSRPFPKWSGFLSIRTGFMARNRIPRVLFGRRFGTRCKARPRRRKQNRESRGSWQSGVCPPRAHHRSLGRGQQRVYLVPLPAATLCSNSISSTPPARMTALGRNGLLQLSLGAGPAAQLRNRWLGTRGAGLAC